MGLPLLQRNRENAWISADRRERLKFALATFALFGSALGAVAFVAYMLVSG